MPAKRIFVVFLLFGSFLLQGQTLPSKQIVFVSDTQEPMWIENVFLKANQNQRATKMIFEDISKAEPRSVYILGDIVSLGFKNKRWKKIDQYIADLRNKNIDVHAVLGNHDVMRKAKRGEVNFQKRFPDHVRTGYVDIVDSVAIVLVNSNFSKLSSDAIVHQQEWYEKMIASLDTFKVVKAVIVTCHHAPYSNSKLVGSNEIVQRRFVTAFLESKKCVLFVTGHSHAFEHFKKSGKDFLAIGGGGGIHQPLGTSLEDTARDYKPMFHYLTVDRMDKKLILFSYYIKDDFSGIEKKYNLSIAIP
ncbi:hypothetical protein BH09BAC3_BH09BAC3_37640 [soil metagenome]